jgi:hypothetical protein
MLLGLFGLISTVLVVSLFYASPALAANGCGGNAECQDDTRVRVTVSCEEDIILGCQTSSTFQSYVCQQIDQDHCDGFAYVDNYFCTGLDQCHYNVKRVTFSCCGSGGGGGGGTCPPGQYWRTVKECRQECNAGWVSAGGCQPACNYPKDCCQKTGCFSCGITAPSDPAATSLTETAARLDWTPGTGGNSQRLYLDELESAVANNCVEGCTLYETGLDPALASFDTGGTSPSTSLRLTVDIFPFFR